MISHQFKEKFWKPESIPGRISGILTFSNVKMDRVKFPSSENKFELKNGSDLETNQEVMTFKNSIYIDLCDFFIA